MDSKDGDIASLVLAVAVAIVLLLAGIWDAWVIFAGHPSRTVSDVIGTWAERWPVVPFLIGMLMGHLLWLRK